jgi:GntR family transcriptional regulator / MocR family aminotransferase
MDVHIYLEGKVDLARQIYRQIRMAILDGRLRRGERLPPTRELSPRLDVSRNTVSLAYAWLRAEGLASGRTGAGTFVQFDAYRRLQPRGGATIRVRAAWRRRAVGQRPENTPRYDFRVGIPDVTQFPFDAWRRMMARQFRLSVLNGEYGDPSGHPQLRAALSRYIAVVRGVKVGSEDVLITNGAQAAFDLIVRVIIEPGSEVAVEDPGYPPLRRLLETYGARVVPIPVDAEGIDVARLPLRAQLVYVTPSHQFPLGMPMSHNRRLLLLAWAEKHNSLVIEDDYDSEFRFGGRPLHPLQALDQRGRVIYVGSFSKSLLPGLRMGFIVPPPSLTQALRAASYTATSHVHWPSQGALAAMIEDGLYARHVRRMRRTYAARHALIQTILGSELAPWLGVVRSEAGLHITARLQRKDAAFERAIVARSREKGVAIDTLSGYYAAAPGQMGIVMGYGAISEDMITEGLRVMRRCLLASR